MLLFYFSIKPYIIDDYLVASCEYDQIKKYQVWSMTTFGDSQEYLIV